MKNNGDFLEIIVANLEMALSDEPTTKIIRRYFIEDRDKCEREIDIYIEFQRNRRIHKYAIECKDWTDNPVDMKDIDEFYSKIANQGMQGVFITTGSFRENAIKKLKVLI